MWKNTSVIILKDDKDVDLYCSIAAKYNLLCLHKIGIYGKLEQHELHIIGSNRNYKSFISEINNLDENEVEEEES